MTVLQLKEKIANAPDNMQVTLLFNDDGEKARHVFFQSVVCHGNGDGSSPENSKSAPYGGDNPINAYKMPEVVLTIG